VNVDGRHQAAFVLSRDPCWRLRCRYVPDSKSAQVAPKD
jgi:hypothetical protein